MQVLSKVLIIRFSSFGDVLEALSLPARLQDLAPGATEVHWVTRAEFVPLMETHPQVHKVWSLDRASGWRGLLALAKCLRQEKFTHVYDAHNNLRSHLLSWLIPSAHFVRKSQKRWQRFLLFKFRKNLFQMPFSGQRDLLEPLAAWGLSSALPPVPQLFLSEATINKVRARLASFQKTSTRVHWVALAPSAAFPLKRWPLSHWREVIEKTTYHFLVLGGRDDHFLAELQTLAPARVLNLAGELTLTESAAAVALADLLIANDTGLLHVAEQLGKPCLALMGPAPFGYPSRPSTEILALELPCRPCSKHGQGPCTNPIYQQCLVGISPQLVIKSAQRQLEK